MELVGAFDLLNPPPVTSTMASASVKGQPLYGTHSAINNL